MTSLPKDRSDQNKPSGLDEFSIIREVFAPLSKSASGAFGLTDDAAIIAPRVGYDLVLTKDTLVAGVHFLASDTPDLIARKCLRVNLSDLAAKGASPLGYLLSCAWPEGTDIDFIRKFAAGLSQDQSEFGLPLLGGDTVRTTGPLTLSITAIGEVPSGQMLLRSGAKAGDHVYLTGTVGDAFVGLRILQGGVPMEATDLESVLLDRYRLPQPRLAMGGALLDIAHASIDVSDGLFADARHLAEASGLQVTIDLQHVPVSKAAQASGIDALTLAAGGDDYEILFTAPPGDAKAIAKLGDDFGLGVKRIGQVTKGKGLRVLDGQGNVVEISDYGYEH